MYSRIHESFFTPKASDMIRVKKMLKWNILAHQPLPPREWREKSIPTNTFSLDFSKVFFLLFSLFLVEYFFLFHFCFYYSGRYKSNTSTPVSRHAWQLIFREGWVIHTISFYKGYFTIMYERLCVYINMEQNSRTNNRKNGELSILAFWVYGYFTCLFFRCCCSAFSVPSKELKILFEARNEKGYWTSRNRRREWTRASGKWGKWKFIMKFSRRRCGVDRGDWRKAEQWDESKGCDCFDESSSIFSQLFLPEKNFKTTFLTLCADFVWVKDEGTKI